MSTKLFPAAIATLLALVLAGCGSGGASQAKNARQLVAQADPICEKIAKEREAANNKLHGKSLSTLAALARIAPPIATAEHQAVARLRTIKAPPSVTSDWNELLAGMELLANDTAKMAVEAKRNDLKGVEALDTSGHQVRERLSTIASRNGFKYCGLTS